MFFKLTEWPGTRACHECTLGTTQICICRFFQFPDADLDLTWTCRYLQVRPDLWHALPGTGKHSPPPWVHYREPQRVGGIFLWYYLHLFGNSIMYFAVYIHVLNYICWNKCHIPQNKRINLCLALVSLGWIRLCVMLMQCQGVFIKCFVILSELGALGLLFFILNLRMTWVIHLNVAER